LSFLSARKKAGLSQADVANAFGVSAAAVCQWETGKTLPDPRKLPRIAKLFGCSVDELLSPDPETVAADASTE
jgi:transcriptional regulator with XRE-family HTH domain